MVFRFHKDGSGNNSGVMLKLFPGLPARPSWRHRVVMHVIQLMAQK